MFRQLTAILVAVMLFSGSVFANWPQYLGPNANATVLDVQLARSWPANGPEVLWTIPLGAGYGSAAISEGKVYVLDRIGNERDSLLCLDLLTGKELWSYSYEAPGKVDHNGSRSVPTIDGDYIYTCGTFGHVCCFDKNTHKPVWQKNVWADFGGGKVPMWGITQHPLIYNDTVILASQTEKAGVVAYDKATGEVKWSSPALPGQVGYVSPKLVTIAGVDQLVMITACSKGAAPDGDGENAVLGAVLGMDAKTGKTLWAYTEFRCRIPIPNVVDIGDGRLFVTGGYKAGSVMLKIEKKDEKFAAAELYKTDGFGVHSHPPVLYRGHLYGHCTTNTRRDGMVCMDLDGKVKWKTAREPIVFDKGGFILAGDLILSVDGGVGILNLIEPSPEGFKRLANVKLLDTRECWAPLALSDGKLIIRDQKQMRCVVVGATG
ncbi:MAG: PQQ-binding-like beta-propeller repeat protein [Sedimentisphaerales bacterium]|nr:PQQ-binding-like beta-propeller repeat protein [Sedimentisphaerales bacterium]